MADQPPVARMRLHGSPHSPFARKVRVAAHELGLAGRIAVGCCSCLGFRSPDLGGRDGCPPLAAWHEGFRARPSAQATEIVDA